MHFVENLTYPEGPVALPDGSWLCVQGEPVGCVTHISADASTVKCLVKTGRPNGLAVDNNGFIWVAESRVPSLLKVSMTGEVEVFLTSCGDEAFMFPNDLCFGPDGYLYMTDSGVLIDDFARGGEVRSDYATVQCNGRVYRINPTNKEITKIDTGIRFTNGIAFGDDGYLYANETLTGNIFRYKVDDNHVGGRELFGNVINPEAEPGYKGPDGMAFDTDGLLYTAVYGQQDVTVMDRSGKVVKRIKTHGKRPTNVCFTNDNQLHVTEYEFGTIELFNINTKGLPLWK